MKWLAFTFLAFLAGGIAGLFAGHHITIEAYGNPANEFAGQFAARAVPLGRMDSPPEDNLGAWESAWSFAESQAHIVGMAFDRVGPQWRRETFRSLDKLNHAAPFLVEAAIPIGMEWQSVRACILRGRDHPGTDVAACVRSVLLPNPGPEPTSDSEKRVAVLIRQQAARYAEKSAGPSTGDAASMNGTHEDVIAATLGWSELRPYFRSRLVYIVNDLERQSRSEQVGTASAEDQGFAATRHCILAVQLELDADVAGCARDAMAGGGHEQVATSELSYEADRLGDERASWGEP